MARYGITFPFDDLPLGEQRDLVSSLPDLGYTDLWSAEANGMDAFTPLALASVWAPQLRLGTAIVPVYTRGPGTLAMCAATMEIAAPGRFVLGVGSSSNVIIEKWNGLAFDQPYQRVRDTVRFLRAALSGEKTLAELSSEFGVHPTMISTWKQELTKRASELFARGNKAPVEDAQRVIDDLHRKIGQLQVERDFLAGQPAISRLLRGGR